MGRSVAGLHSALQRRHLHNRLRDFGRLPSLRGALWGTRKTLAALSATAVLVGGCGGAGADGEGDPATAAPQDALVYAELVVRPEGSQREHALDAAGKVLLTDDPEAEIRRLMRLAFADTGEDFDFDRDVEPWLGERAAFWVRPSEAKDNFGALLLATTDADEAEASLKASLERGGKPVAERSHGGADYLVNSEEVAAGIVGDFAVIAREAEYKRTIDASKGDSLAEADDYSDAIDALEDDRLAHFWVDTPGLIEVARGEARARADQLSALVPLEDLPPIAGSFAADGDRLAVEVKARGSQLGPLMGGGSTPLLQELPGDSWAALGSADVGETLRGTIDGFAGALGGLVVRRELQREYGLDLDRDLLDWIGHVGFFVRGTTLATLDGGVVIQPTDEDRAAAAFGRIVGAVQVEEKVRAEPVDIAGADQAFAISDWRSPRPLVIARGSGLVVVTAGRAAAEAALGSDDRLGDTELYAEAEELVGMEPGALLSMPALLEFAGPQLGEAEPYLEAYSVLAAGTVADGDEVVGRVAAGLE
jgi:Protein of unknown function (DUF3352)